MSDNEFGHKDWPTVPGKMTLEKIRELVEAPIWVLVYNWSYDSGHYRPDWDEKVETNKGFFRSEEEAQAEADRLNDYPGKYVEYMLKTDRENQVKQEAHAQRLLAWSALAEKGLEPSDYMGKPTLSLKTPLEFEEWKSATVRDEYYSVEKLEFNRG
jgi:hypothetical protein